MKIFCHSYYGKEISTWIIVWLYPLLIIYLLIDLYERIGTEFFLKALLMYFTCAIIPLVAAHLLIFQYIFRNLFLFNDRIEFEYIKIYSWFGWHPPTVLEREKIKKITASALFITIYLKDGNKYRLVIPDHAGERESVADYIDFNHSKIRRFLPFLFYKHHSMYGYLLAERLKVPFSGKVLRKIHQSQQSPNTYEYQG